MLTMVVYKNPMDFLEVDNIEKSKEIKEIIMDYIVSEKTENDLSTAVYKLGWLADVSFEYMNQTRNLKVKWSIKNKNLEFKYFQESVFIVDVHKDGRVKFSTIFKTDTEEQTFKFIKLKESNTQKEFLKKVCSNKDFEDIKSTEIDFNKLERALHEMKSVGNAESISFSVDEIIPCDKLDKKGVGISYYPGKNLNSEHNWTFGFYLNEGAYIKSFNIMFKGAVFEKDEKTDGWILRRVDFHPLEKDLPIGISSFSYGSCSNGTKILQGPSLSIIVDENSSVVFRYGVKDVFDTELLEVNFSNSLCLFGLKESIYLRSENDFSMQETIKGDKISDDLKVQLFYNYLCSVFDEKVVIKELFLKLLNKEISEEDFLFLLEVNIGISNEEVVEVSAKINEIKKLLNLIPDDGNLAFPEMLKIKESFENES